LLSFAHFAVLGQTTSNDTYLKCYLKC